MGKKPTLFSFVYEDMKEQILTGVRPHGSKLPSAPQLCRIYDAGMRTITSVVRALREEGLIQTTERGRATVVYRGLPVDQGARSVLSRRANVMEVYQTMALLMPDILAFCAGFFDVVELEEYENAVKWARRPDTRPGQWRAASALLHGALRTSGNLLFNNLYATLEVYAEVPFFSESQQSVTGHSFEQEHLGTHRVLDILKTRDPARQHRLFLSYYHDIAQTMEATFSRLREKLPDVAEDSARRFTWSAERGRYPRYLQIALDLVEKIGIGVYPAGTFLPPEVALAKQYGVTADTLRKAIRFLNDIGFAHTRDRVGTYVVSPDRYAYRGHSNKTGILSISAPCSLWRWPFARQRCWSLIGWTPKRSNADSPGPTASLWRISWIIS